jgi:EAL domain-containing protein (putative c-di-GMP-specific phosphodiesterase class I)
VKTITIDTGPGLPAAADPVDHREANREDNTNGCEHDGGYQPTSQLLSGLTFDSSSGQLHGLPQPEVRRTLENVRRFFDMPAALVLELTGAPPSGSAPDAREWVVRYVDGDNPVPIAVGRRWSTRETIARLVLDRGRPLVVPDLGLHPEFAATALIRDLRARSYVGVPLVLPDGEEYGVLCAFGPQSDARLRARDGEMLRLVAELLAESIGHHREANRIYTQTVEVIRRALEPGGIRAAYQPILDLDSGGIVGHEALARFARPPAWSPDLWFAAARSIGFGVELEVAAISAALADRPTTPAGAYVSLNVSPATLGSPELVAVLDGVPLHDIVFEITEHEDYEINARLIATIEQWRQAGARIAIDDAGSGYSGLHQVLYLRPEILKLDRSLVHGSADDPARQALAWSLSWFARRTGADLVAEGIETSAELEIMHSMGVRYGQGFYLGHPEPAYA